MLRKVLLIVLGLGVLVIVLLYSFNKSEGYRVGVPVKVSYKGYIIKTHEGQLNIGGLTNSAEGVLPTQWDFSVKDSDSQVLDDLETAISNGGRVKVFYKEKLVHLPWRGDTKYFVYQVEEVE